jgi:outer membrane protein OmpA-like peptidoglycan-associated protein
MSSLHLRPDLRLAGFLLAAALLAPAGLTGCKRDPCKKNPELPECSEGDTDDVETQRISLVRKIEVSQVRPDLIEPNTGLTLDVLGAGFDGRPRVSFGTFDGTNVVRHTSARLSVDVPPLPEGRYDVTVTNSDGEAATLVRGLMVQPAPADPVDCDRLVVRFGFDEDALDGEARDAIDPLVPCYQDVTGRIRLEGHADARGTIDYNLALGQRRADAVLGYLTAQGVPVRRLRTVSYGEERPADPRMNEEAWAANRRVVLQVED